jgi:phage-related protein
MSDGLMSRIELHDESVWLTLNQMAELFQVDNSGISRHLKNIFTTDELRRESVVANFATTATDGKAYRVDSNGDNHDSGTESVRDWILSLPHGERQKIGRAIRLVECDCPIGMPICRSLGDGIFEVRVSLDKRIARVMFCVAVGEMWLLHGFIKTTQKTPPRDMHLARQRRGDLLGGTP